MSTVRLASTPANCGPILTAFRYSPLGFIARGPYGSEEANFRHYRGVELKHGRVAMLAALGFPLAEQVYTQPGSARVVG